MSKIRRHNSFRVDSDLAEEFADFIAKTEQLSRKKKGKREYLGNPQTRDLMRKLKHFFESTVEVPRVRVGEKQSIETLINEEAFVFAKHLRHESPEWNPRLVASKGV